MQVKLTATPSCVPAALQRHTPSQNKDDNACCQWPIECVDQTAFANVGEANDAEGGALRRARFVCLDKPECQGVTAISKPWAFYTSLQVVLYRYYSAS
jgi:hypothetical protein